MQPNDSETTEKESISVSTLDTTIIKVQQSIIKKAISKMEDRNDNRTVEENKFDYNGQRFKYFNECVQRFNQNEVRMQIANSSSISDKQILLKDMAKYYAEHRQYCTEKTPDCIDMDNLVDFYVYVLGDRNEKVVEFTAEAKKYVFQLPDIWRPENTKDTKYIPGDLPSEIQFLKNDEEFYKKINPHLYRFEINILDILNKVSPTNIDQITKDIVLEFSKKATEKELQKIPKVLLYIILDNIIAKACIEPKFSQTYTNLILKLTHSEAFVKIILNSKYDQDTIKN